MRIEQPNPNDNDLDALLSAGLKNHSVNIPPDFAQNLLTRIRRQEYAAALSAIKMKERLLLATMILLPLALVAVAMFIPLQVMTQVTTSMADIYHSFLPEPAPALRQWLVIAVATALLLYGLFDSFLTEN